MTAYYVSNSGNDGNTGLIGDPFETAQKAADTAVAGDTVNFHAGTYRIDPAHPSYGRTDTPMMICATDGSSGNPITFTTVGDGTVTFTRDGLGFNTVEVRSDYITIDGGTFGDLVVTGGRRRGILVAENPDSVRQGNILSPIVRNVIAHGNSTVSGIGGEYPGIHISASTDALVEYCEAYDNGTGIGLGADPGGLAPPNDPDDRDVDAMLGQPIDPTVRYCYSHENAIVNDEGDSDGFVLRAQGMLIEYCVAYFNSDDGFDIEDAVNSVSRSSRVHHCVAFQNGFTSTTVTANGQGFKNRFGSGFTFDHNIAFFNRSIGFAEDGLNFLRGNSHYNNVAYKNGNIGFYFASREAIAKNNIAYLNDWLYQGSTGPRDFVNGSRGPDEDIKVNPNVDQGGTYGGANQQWKEQPDYNLIGDGVFFLNEGSNSLTNGSVTDPEFAIADFPNCIVDVTDANFAYCIGFELALISPCIDAGVDVGYAYNDAAPDMGVYESDGTPAVDPAGFNLLYGPIGVARRLVGA